MPNNLGAAQFPVDLANHISTFLFGLPADQLPSLDFSTPFFIALIPTHGGSDKPESSPASKASIDAMPKVTVTEDQDGVHDCAICLDEMNVGGESREMPCKHRFHSNCIVKWLGIHGSCPVCRFMMPVEDVHDDDDVGDGSEDGRRQRRRMTMIAVNFAFDPVRLSPGDDSGSG
ncbi:RING/U-box superfamily protein [Euphorbia peplus]|nr:RING/U-box superfamily protein [Euphorbia peplus]